MADMRAKFRVTDVAVNKSGDTTTSIDLKMMAVTDAPFDKDGVSDDNSFARWTPSGALSMSIQNPALFERFKQGQKYYIDFTEAAE